MTQDTHNYIAFTGFQKQDSNYLRNKWKLKDTTFVDKISKTTTHIICKKFVRTEKMLIAIMQGCWVVKESFLAASFEAGGTLVNEQDHLFSDIGIYRNCSGKVRNKKPFSGWQCVVDVPDNVSLRSLSSILKAGGATVHEIANGIEESLTHVFFHKLHEYESYYLNLQREQLLLNDESSDQSKPNFLCLESRYISDTIVLQNKPLKIENYLPVWDKLSPSTLLDNNKSMKSPDKKAVSNVSPKGRGKKSSNTTMFEDSDDSTGFKGNSFTDTVLVQLEYGINEGLQMAQSIKHLIFLDPETMNRFLQCILTPSESLLLRKRCSKFVLDVIHRILNEKNSEISFQFITELFKSPILDLLEFYMVNYDYVILEFLINFVEIDFESFRKSQKTSILSKQFWPDPHFHFNNKVENFCLLWSKLIVTLDNTHEICRLGDLIFILLKTMHTKYRRYYKLKYEYALVVKLTIRCLAYSLLEMCKDLTRVRFILDSVHNNYLKVSTHLHALLKISNSSYVEPANWPKFIVVLAEAYTPALESRGKGDRTSERGEIEESTAFLSSAEDDAKGNRCSRGSDRIRCRIKSAVMPGTKCKGENDSFDIDDDYDTSFSKESVKNKIWCNRDAVDLTPQEKSVMIKCIIELLYYCKSKSFRMIIINRLKNIATGDDIVLVEDYKKLFDSANSETF